MDLGKVVAIQHAGGVFNELSAGALDRANITTVRDLFERMVKHLLAHELLDDSTDLELVITNPGDHHLSTFIKKVDDVHLIFVNIRLIRSIWNLLVLSLCDPGIIPGYPGDSEVNYTWRMVLPKELITGLPVIPVVHSDLLEKSCYSDTHQPITEERLELCDQLFHSIIDYILYHEAMHMTRDHITFNKLYNTEFLLSDLKADSKRRLRYYQLIELDADLMALTQNIQSHDEFREQSGFTESERKNFVFLEIIESVIVQQLVDLDHTDMNTQLLHNYPPAVFRAVLWTQLLRQILHKYKVVSQEQFFEEQNYAWVEAAKIAMKLGFPEGRWHGSHMKDVPFNIIDQWIDAHNALSDIFERSYESNNLEEFRQYLEGLS